MSKVIPAAKKGKPSHEKCAIEWNKKRGHSGQEQYREFFRLILPITLAAMVIGFGLMWVVNNLWINPDFLNRDAQMIPPANEQGADGLSAGDGSGEEISGSGIEGPVVALTFDDGPDENVTAMLIDALDERGVKVTFFVIGIYAQEYPDIIKKAYDSGHQICSHTCDHVSLTKLDEEELAYQINQNIKIIQDIIGEAPRFIRPPLAAINEKTAAQIGWPIMMWTVDPRDWESRNADTVYQNIMDNIYDGAVIILHDRFPTTVDAVTRVVDTLLDRGWCFVTLDEYYQYYDIKPASGQVYRGTTEIYPKKCITIR